MCNGMALSLIDTTSSFLFIISPTPLPPLFPVGAIYATPLTSSCLIRAECNKTPPSLLPHWAAANQMELVVIEGTRPEYERETSER